MFVCAKLHRLVQWVPTATLLGGIQGSDVTAVCSALGLHSLAHVCTCCATPGGLLSVALLFFLGFLP